MSFARRLLRSPLLTGWASLATIAVFALGVVTAVQRDNAQTITNNYNESSSLAASLQRDLEAEKAKSADLQRQLDAARAPAAPTGPPNSSAPATAGYRTVYGDQALTLRDPQCGGNFLVNLDELKIDTGGSMVEPTFNYDSCAKSKATLQRASGVEISRLADNNPANADSCNISLNTSAYPNPVEVSGAMRLCFRTPKKNVALMEVTKVTDDNTASTKVTLWGKTD